MQSWGSLFLWVVVGRRPCGAGENCAVSPKPWDKPEEEKAREHFPHYPSPLEQSRERQINGSADLAVWELNLFGERGPSTRWESSI